MAKMDDDAVLIESLTELLPLVETDMTIFFRNLSTVQKEDTPVIDFQYNKRSLL